MENKCFTNKINCFFESQFHLFACSTISLISCICEVDRSSLTAKACCYKHTNTCISLRSVHVTVAFGVQTSGTEKHSRYGRNPLFIIYSFDSSCITYPVNQWKFTLRVYLCWDDLKLSIHRPIPPKVHWNCNVHQIKFSHRMLWNNSHLKKEMNRTNLLGKSRIFSMLSVFY